MRALERAADLYVSACERDRRASDCVWAFSLSVDQHGRTWDERSTRSLRVLVPLCLSGHNVDACRVFEGYRTAFSPAFFEDVGAVCKAGLLVACDALAHRLAPAPEAWRLYEQSCNAGDWDACGSLEVNYRYEERPQHEIEEVHTKGKVAARAACALGQPIACLNSTQLLTGDEYTRAEHLAAPMIAQRCPRGYLMECSYLDEDDRWLALRCSQTGVDCDGVADARRDKPLLERDALETGCQFQNLDLCVQLVKGYRDRRFPEPIAGRADALAKYLCGPVEDFGHGACDQVQQ